MNIMSIWPQIAWIMLVFLSLGVSLGKHGQPYDRPLSFWWALGNSAVWSFIAWAGGFFEPLINGVR